MNPLRAPCRVGMRALFTPVAMALTSGFAALDKDCGSQPRERWLICSWCALQGLIEDALEGRLGAGRDVKHSLVILKRYCQALLFVHASLVLTLFRLPYFAPRLLFLLLKDYHLSFNVLLAHASAWTHSPLICVYLFKSPHQDNLTCSSLNVNLFVFFLP